MIVEKRMPLRLDDIEKFVDASGARTFSGLASTGDVDRVGDIVEPRGGIWQLPLPVLLNHNHERIVGQVRTATATAEGVRVTIDIAEGFADADLAWLYVQSKLIESMSIGFRPLERAPLASGGWRFTKWELLEVSLVAVPANASARIGRQYQPGEGAVKLLQPLPPLPRGSVRLVGGRR